MSKMIQMGGWISIIPDKMYDSFAARKFFPKGKTKFCDLVFYKGWRRFLRAKFQKGYTMIKPEHYSIMHKEIGVWYAEVFNYVTKWLKEHKYISLKQGSFSGGFCAEESANSETAKNWGAPVAKRNNKVAQIKEKFGEIRVYFNGLTKQERSQIKKFAKSVEKKFDCSTLFC